MKPYLVFLCAMAAVVFIAWLGGVKREPPGEPVSISAFGKTVYPKDPLDRWLAIMEIWECDGGGYELKTTIQVIGEYETLEAARTAKTNRAKEALEAYRRGDFDRPIPVRPDCKRVE